METLALGLFLTTTLLVSEPTPKGREAASYAAHATYKATGYDKLVEPQIKELERKYAPEILKKYGVGLTVLHRLLVDQKIEYAWSF